ncbi:hypothetical protein BBP40_009449 [Aspergillus hancockii]|nr:hypothetical protein BBP40_009449 [Aspergillus hancockii]
MVEGCAVGLWDYPGLRIQIGGIGVAQEIRILLWEDLTLDILWLLSKAWYHDKHTYEYDREAPAKVETLFDELGINSECGKSR